MDSKSISPFKQLGIKMKIHLPPCYSADVRSGVEYRLNRFVKSFVDDLNGFLLAYWNLQLLDELGTIIDEDPHIHFTIGADVLVFCPKQGDKLLGRVNKVGMDHIGLLVFGVFNVTIPNESIPSMYSRDMENDCWIRSAPDGSTVTIADGTLLTFTVNSVEIFHHDIASILGSLLEVGTGPLDSTLQLDEMQQSTAFDHEPKKAETVKANDNKLSPIHQPKKLSKKLKSSKQINQMDTFVDAAPEDNVSTHDTSQHTKQSTSKLKSKPPLSSPTPKVTSNKKLQLSKKSKSANLVADTSIPTSNDSKVPTKKRKVE